MRLCGAVLRDGKGSEMDASGVMRKRECNQGGVNYGGESAVDGRSHGYHCHADVAASRRRRDISGLVVAGVDAVLGCAAGLCSRFGVGLSLGSCSRTIAARTLTQAPAAAATNWNMRDASGQAVDTKFNAPRRMELRQLQPDTGRSLRLGYTQSPGAQLVARYVLTTTIPSGQQGLRCHVRFLCILNASRNLKSRQFARLIRSWPAM